MRYWGSRHTCSDFELDVSGGFENFDSPVAEQHEIWLLPRIPQFADNCHFWLSDDKVDCGCVREHTFWPPPRKLETGCCGQALTDFFLKHLRADLTSFGSRHVVELRVKPRLLWCAYVKRPNGT